MQERRLISQGVLYRGLRWPTRADGWVTIAKTGSVRFKGNTGRRNDLPHDERDHRSQAAPRIYLVCPCREQWRERLVQALEPLRNDGFVDAWHDDMLLPGDRFHAKILSRLADAELVVLLVSPALLKSEYVQAHEIPLALERAESADAGLCRCCWSRATGRSRVRPISALPAISCPWRSDPTSTRLWRTASSGYEESLRRHRRADSIRAINPSSGSLHSVRDTRRGAAQRAALIDTARKIARDDSVRTNRVERLPASEGDSGKSRWDGGWRVRPRRFAQSKTRTGRDCSQALWGSRRSRWRGPWARCFSPGRMLRPRARLRRRWTGRSGRA